MVCRIFNIARALNNLPRPLPPNSKQLSIAMIPNTAISLRSWGLGTAVCDMSLIAYQKQPRAAPTHRYGTLRVVHLWQNNPNTKTPQRNG